MQRVIKMSFSIHWLNFYIKKSKINFIAKKKKTKNILFKTKIHVISYGKQLRTPDDQCCYVVVVSLKAILIEIIIDNNAERG